MFVKPPPPNPPPFSRHRFFDRDLNAVVSNKFMDDATRVNCPVCSTIAADRCSYCFKSKTSNVARLHMHELAALLLKVTR